MPIAPEHKEILLSQSKSKTLPENWKIYIHINTINNKVYIGQTKQSLKKRWKYGFGYKTQSYFYNAIKKYGWKNFKHEILEDNIKTLEEANEKEFFWINFYDSTNPKKGYNVSKGGVDFKQLELAHQGWTLWKTNHPEHFQKNVEKMQKASVKKCSIPVKNIELNIVYYSAGEASRQTGADQSGITKCCKKKQKTAGGYHWEYADVKRT